MFNEKKKIGPLITFFIKLVFYSFPVSVVINVIDFRTSLPPKVTDRCKQIVVTPLLF